MLPIDCLNDAPQKARHLSWPAAWGALLAVVATGAVEHLMGRRLLCACGVVRLWVGAASGAETSQQIFDWYSFSHVIHGFLLFAPTRFVGRRWNWSVGVCLMIAVGLECTWELLENSTFIISRYRKTMAESYDGDSVLNSMSDICCAIFGFFLAARLPVWVVVSSIVAMEVGVGFVIHDNLTLNVIMLIHPFGAIRRWQVGH